jgi:hypothetical protein
MDQNSLDKFLGLTSKVSFHMQLRCLTDALKFTHRVVSDRKQAVLNGYVQYCAVKIQKVFRGGRARRHILPFRRAFGADTVARLEAAALGYRTRKIMNLK